MNICYVVFYGFSLWGYGVVYLCVDFYLFVFVNILVKFRGYFNGKGNFVVFYLFVYICIVGNCGFFIKVVGVR